MENEELVKKVEDLTKEIEAMKVSMMESSKVEDEPKPEKEPVAVELNF